MLFLLDRSAALALPQHFASSFLLQILDTAPPKKKKKERKKENFPDSPVPGSEVDSQQVASSPAPTQKHTGSLTRYTYIC
jgi:hypothetical protein